MRLGVVLDNFSPHLSTKDDARVGDWAAANNIELAYPNQRLVAEPDRGPVPGASLLHPGRHRPPSHHEQASMIGRYIAWRNQHAIISGYAKSSTGAKVA
jgi:hypothetical protein